MNAVSRICWGISTGLQIGLIGAIFMALGGTGVATAQIESVYTVGTVDLDMTAETAAAAREHAIAAGHDLAFRRLIARLVPESRRAALPTLSPAEVAPLVLSFEIGSEKRSFVRYLGRLKFRFRRADVRAFLQNSGVVFAETRSKPVLLLPVYHFAGAKLLWDDPNPWFLAWNAVPPSDGLVPLRLPAGDLVDVRDISAEQAVTGNAEQLAIVADRYGASAVLVAEASVVIDSGSGARALTVATTYFGGTSDARTAVRSFLYAEGDTDEAVIGRAAMQVALQIEEDWKQENLIRFDNQNSLIAEVALSDLRQWVELGRKLQGVSFLHNWQLVAMSRHNASVRLSYYGAAEQLRVALAQRDLVLEQAAVDWVLRDSRLVKSVAPAPTITPVDREPVPFGAEAPVLQPSEGPALWVPAR